MVFAVATWTISSFRNICGNRRSQMSLIHQYSLRESRQNESEISHPQLIFIEHPSALHSIFAEKSDFSESIRHDDSPPDYLDIVGRITMGRCSIARFRKQLAKAPQNFCQGLRELRQLQRTFLVPDVRGYAKRRFVSPESRNESVGAE